VADIKQAATWLKEEKKVRRTLWKPDGGWPLYVVANEGDCVVREDTGCRFDFFTYDLAADDWEIAR
jgi:hypothetical protein